jgi:UDP-2,3-diacylglucosamine hydrolase
MAEAEPSRAVFFSDVHVSPDAPEKSAALVAFLDGLGAARCEHAYILGDLFNFWVGRGHEGMPGYREVVARLAALRAGGCGLTIVHGNRDFHLGDEIARATGATIVPEGATIRLGGRAIHLAHGDLLCLRDTSYQAMRRVIRSGAARRGFLALPLEARLSVARGFRRQSVRSTRHKAAASPRSFSLSPCAVRRLFRGDVDMAVVGHVHHARRIALEVAGRTRVLFTLGSWDDGNRSWLEWRDGGFTLYDGPAAERILVEG